MSSKYLLKLENFEGPFELLFHLLEKDKINIYDIPIVKITEQYIEYIEAAKSMDLELASEFMVMAATLLNIKSKMLLPKSPLKKEDEEDPREELVQKLIEYKIYKEIAKYFEQAELDANKNFARSKKDNIKYKDNVKIVLDVSIDKLVDAFKNVLKRKELNEKLKNTDSFIHQISREEFTIEDKMQYIKDNVSRKSEIIFYSLFDEDYTRAEIVTTFLALLELIKLKIIIVVQKDVFSDIFISKPTAKGA